ANERGARTREPESGSKVRTERFDVLRNPLFPLHFCPIGRQRSEPLVAVVPECKEGRYGLKNLAPGDRSFRQSKSLCLDRFVLLSILTGRHTEFAAKCFVEGELG